MFGGQGGGDPPPYSFHQLPTSTTAAGVPQQSAPAAPSSGVFGTGGTLAGVPFGQVTSSSAAFGQPSSLFGQPAPATASWSTAGTTSTPGTTLFGRTPSDGGIALSGQQTVPGPTSPATGTATFGSVAASGPAASGAALFGQPVSSPMVFGQTSSTVASTFGQVSAAAGPGFGQVTSPGSATSQSVAAVFGTDTSAPSAVFSQPVPSADTVKTWLSGDTAPAAPAASAITDAAGATIRSLFGAGTADSAGPALFGKTSDNTGLFGKPKPAAAEPGDSAAAQRPSGLFGKGDGGGEKLGLFGKPRPAESAAAPDGDAPAEEGEKEAPPPSGTGRLRSVFARPTAADSPAARRRRPSTTAAAEAARRTLARTGLFGKPAEPRAADKSPGETRRLSVKPYYLRI